VVGRDDQPVAGDGQAGHFGVAERPVVPLKPSNVGGGKGPQFKIGTGSGEVEEIGETLGNSVKLRELRKVSQAEVKEERGY
jgi:hypothetical protein